ncbi:hypothetical protein [Paenibacillus sanguinis]|uniref:hypothetical protein n=1 Tax=Paenibacillus sanguinis TaxID=225906 RepID=UPI000375B510|nr:hypothetical protein [Paenibacillus sanguinis]
MNNVPNLQTLFNELIDSIGCNNDGLGKRAVAQIVRNAVRMPGFSLLDYYVEAL